MADDSRKTALITGATNGIGRAAAAALAADGWRVVIAARNPQRSEATVNEIRRATSNDQVEAIPLDLASFDSVRQGAEAALEVAPQLDVLINNAGLNLTDRSVTADGLETMMQTNHFGHFLFTSRLLPRLLESDDARLVNVTSMVHQRAGPMPFDDLNLEQRWGAFWPYAVSKQANILFTHELHRRYHDAGLAAYSLHPGGVRTNFGQDGMMRGPLAWMLSIFRPLMLSPEKGAAPLVELAVKDKRSDAGAYFSRHNVADPAPDAQDPAAAERLWDASNEITEAEWPDA